MEGRFLVKSLWITLWNSMALRLFGAGVKLPGQRKLPLHSE
jgi:hypothetical protein